MGKGKRMALAVGIVAALLWTLAAVWVIIGPIPAAPDRFAPVPTSSYTPTPPVMRFAEDDPGWIDAGCGDGICGPETARVGMARRKA